MIMQISFFKTWHRIDAQWIMPDMASFAMSQKWDEHTHCLHIVTYLLL